MKTSFLKAAINTKANPKIHRHHDYVVATNKLELNFTKPVNYMSLKT